MIYVLLSVALVTGLFLFGEMLDKIYKNISGYNAMKSRGFVLMKNDKGEDFWVGYGD